jgi:hypothetical protein
MEAIHDGRESQPSGAFNTTNDFQVSNDSLQSYMIKAVVVGWGTKTFDLVKTNLLR